MVGAGRELVEEEINGLHFPAGDTAALAEKMQRFVVQPALCDNWGGNSRRKARHWTPEVGAEKWVATFRTILSA
jgi:glycosyltransferase involved in cell wall biosynthesis